MMKFVRTVVATLCFLVLLVAIYYVHISYFAVNVVFYAAIADGVIATALVALALFFARYFRPLGHFEKLQLIVILLITGYAIAISVPTVIDRSLSFYILEKLEQRGGGIKQASFADVFTKEYLKEYRLVDIRLTEQLQSGTIEIENGCVKLTKKGHELVRFSSYFRKNWLPKERLLMGQYSDDLTDPFRNSVASPGYECK
jgi:hypothetical protein